MTNVIVPVEIGNPVYCLIDGEVVRRICIGYANDGLNFEIVTDKNEELVYLCDAFPTRAEANAEIRNRLRDI